MSALPPPLSKLAAWMDARLERIQARRLGGRLDPYLGFGELRRVGPLWALIPMLVLLALGLRRSQFGHMDTVGGIFPIMALVSGLNPFVGLLSALAYGAGDLLQKFVTDDVFYEGVRTAGDYWGARLGYLIGYSALITFGVAPGVCSRIGRRIAMRVAADQRGGTAGGSPQPPLAASASAAAAVVGAVLGGVVGTIAASFVWKVAVIPAFLLRPTPDHSCLALSGSNVVAAIPPASVAGGAGGGAATAGSSALAPPGSGAAPPSTQVAPPGSGPAPPSTQLAPPGSQAGYPAVTSVPAASPPVGPGATPLATTAPGPTEGVVVSGPEAIAELIAAGHPTVVRGGVTHVLPTGPRGSITGIGTGGLITLPTGEQVIDPNSVAIVKNVPVRTGPTSTVQGGPAVDALVGQGFPTHTDPATGRTFVKYPPALIHGNVTGVAVGGTTVVDGVEVIDPTKGVVVLQTGPPAPPPAPPPVSPPVTPPVTVPVTPPVVTSPVTPPVTPPVTVPVTPPVVTPPVTPPGTPPVTVPVTPPGTPPVTVPVTPPPDPSPPPTQPPPPPRTPTDAASLRDSLTKPGTTVITPDNVPGFAPEILTPDGKIKVTDPHAPAPIKALNGTKAPTPEVKDGKVGLTMPMGLGHVEVSLRVEGGRLVADTKTSGGIKSIEEASSFAHLASEEVPVLDAGKSVQARIDRYNRMIDKAGLEVKSVTAQGGQIQIQTGPRS